MLVGGSCEKGLLRGVQVISRNQPEQLCFWPSSFEREKLRSVPGGELVERKNVVEGMNVVGEEGNVVENEGNVAEDRVAERW